MGNTFVQIFKHIFMEVLYHFYASVWKNFLGIMEKYVIIGIDIDIDTRESIDTYGYFLISISIDTFTSIRASTSEGSSTNSNLKLAAALSVYLSLFRIVVLSIRDVAVASPFHSSAIRSDPLPFNRYYSLIGPRSRNGRPVNPPVYYS